MSENCKAVFNQYSEISHATLITETADRILLRDRANPAGFMLCQNSCAGYHYGWIVLQKLGIISGLKSERGRIAADIRKAAATVEIKRILIAGAADFGLLSLVHEALGSECLEKEIVVTDRCATPLKLSEEYAGLFGIPATIEQQDLLALEIGPAFDLIICHSILSFFSPAHRAGLIHKLTTLLAPGGTLLLYQSIRPDKGEEVLSYRQQEIDVMLELARARYSAKDNFSNARMETIVREFCGAKKTYSVPSNTIVHGYLTDSGLHVESNLMFDSAHTSHKAGTTAGAYEKYAFTGYRPRS